MSHEKMTRNREILTKHKNGASYIQLADEYNLSRPRIIQIIQHVKKMDNRGYVDIPVIQSACEEVGTSDRMYQRIVNAFHDSHTDIHNRWQRMSESEIRSLKNIGDLATKVILRAQELVKN